MKLRWAILILFFAAGLFSPPASAALSFSNNNSIESIEWAVFNADVIVRAQVVEVKTRNVVPLQPVTTTVSSSQPTGKAIYICTLKVTEILKSPPDLAGVKTFTFAYWGNPEIGGESLCFLHSIAHHFDTKAPTTRQIASLGGESWVASEIISLDPITNERVFDSARQVHEGPDAILNVVRNEAQHPPSEQFGSLDLGFSTRGQFNRGTYIFYQSLKILLDRRAETRARQLIKSPNPEDRWNGLRVLQHFRSPENASLLQICLADSSTDPPPTNNFDVLYLSIPSGKWAANHYEIRNLAWSTLREWGLSPPIVPVDEPKYPPVFVRSWVPVTWAFSLIGMSFAIVLIVWIKRGRFLSGLSALSLFLLLLTAALWVWSRWHIGEVILCNAPNSDRNEIALLDGRLRWMKIENWPDLTPANITLVSRTPSTQKDWQPQWAGWSVGTPPFQSEHVGNCGFTFDKDEMAAGSSNVSVYRAYTAPLWPLLILFAVLPITTLLRIRRRHRFAKQNRCLNCGYDLRASLIRCPECGREF